jgi:hypothetical protein
MDHNPINSIDFSEYQSTEVVEMRLVLLILRQAIADHASKVELSMVRTWTGTKVRLVYIIKNSSRKMPSPPKSLFASTVEAFCEYASVVYRPGCEVRGKIKTLCPDSSWVLESRDLVKGLTLTLEEKIG